VHFFAENVPTGAGIFAGVGIYAEIVPQGHFWHNLMGVFD